MLLYLDPGSGSFLLQLLIAGLAGLSIFLGLQWAKVKKLFRKRQDSAQNQDDEE